jgi:drug/metabolite transporter (DMT)-like permease
MAYTAPRFILASGVFALLALIGEGSLRVARRDFAILALAGLVGIFLNQLAFVFALRHSSATTVALLFGTIPVFTGVLSHLSGYETLGLRQWLAALASFLGVAMVVLGASGHFSSDALGLMLAIAAPLTWAVYSVAVAPLLERYSPIRVNAVVCLVGSIPLVAISTGDLRQQEWSAPSGLKWAALIYGTVIAYVLATLVWLVAIRVIGAPKAALFQNLQPFLGALFAVAILSENLSALEVAGGAIITGSIIAASRARSARIVGTEVKV